MAAPPLLLLSFFNCLAPVRGWEGSWPALPQIETRWKAGPSGQAPLLWCLAIGWCFATRNFRLPRGASDEHTLQRSVRSEQRSGRRKGLRPGGLRRKRPGASLLLGHRALRLCSLVAPCPRPFWAQRNTSQLRDTTPGCKRSSGVAARGSWHSSGRIESKFRVSTLGFGVFPLELLWSLVFGVWCLEL